MGHDEMKRAWPIICILLVLGIAVSALLAYRLGAKREEQDIWAFMAIQDAEKDLKILGALQSNQVDWVLRKTELDLWDSVMPIHTQRDQHADPITPDPDDILSATARHFAGHPFMTTPLDNLSDQHEREHTRETRAVLSKYLENRKNAPTNESNATSGKPR